MAEKSIPDKIVEEFITKITQMEILGPEKLTALEKVLIEEKPTKAAILEIIRRND